ncbi:MAG: ArnT family glycosyltransferase, partial [Mycobacteriales bacterium]
GNPHFSGLFPVVRAHPLLLQVLMSPLYAHGVHDTVGRYVAGLFGVATVGLVFVLGRVLWDRRAGALAALLLAVMPYHVLVTRQVLLDGPMTFFSTAALTCLALAVRTDRGRWVVAAGGCVGLAALSKETGVVLLAGGFLFLSLTDRLRRPLGHLLGGGALALGLAYTYPLVTALAGGGRSGQSYLVYQLTRPPNHGSGFYLRSFAAMGTAAVVVGAGGLLLPRLARRGLGWQETLLLSWAAAPLVFFEVWPVKGFSYLLPLAPVVALLAARALTPADGLAAGRLRPVLAGALALSLALPAAAGVTSPATSGLAGAGGLPGGRETGRWVAAHVPAGDQLMTIGPSMANLVMFYSGRRSDGLSVSPNPLHRNPSYRPIVNPAGALRAGAYQYVVWDAWSAARSPRFAARAVSLAERFHGRVVHVERGTLRGRPGQRLVVVYQVSP